MKERKQVKIESTGLPHQTTVRTPEGIDISDCIQSINWDIDGDGMANAFITFTNVAMSGKAGVVADLITVEDLAEIAERKGYRLIVCEDVEITDENSEWIDITTMEDSRGKRVYLPSRKITKDF